MSVKSRSGSTNDHREPRPEQVIPYQMLVKYGSSHAVKTAGLLRVEGKAYAIQGGDMLYFRFKV